MMKLMWRQGLRVSIGLALVLAAVLMAPAAAQAQITRVSSSASDRRQAVGVTFGGFFLKGEDSRADGDVLFADLDSLAFDIKRLQRTRSINGEWNLGLERLPRSRLQRRLLPADGAKRLRQHRSTRTVPRSSRS